MVRGALIEKVASVAEVTEAILKAKREKNIIRITGSAHSVYPSVFPKDGITLCLTSDLRKVEIQKFDWKVKKTGFSVAQVRGVT